MRLIAPTVVILRVILVAEGAVRLVAVRIRVAILVELDVVLDVLVVLLLLRKLRVGTLLVKRMRHLVMMGVTIL